MALGPLLALPLARFPMLRFAGLIFDHVRAAVLPLFSATLPVLNTLAAAPCGWHNAIWAPLLLLSIGDRLHKLAPSACCTVHGST
jgi:hypothetical protein